MSGTKFGQTFTKMSIARNRSNTCDRVKLSRPKQIKTVLQGEQESCAIE
ncbi:hypothetical protein [Tychonema sp. LEGE 07203]|nr:hypothetical protein [Tychonema sp. LEGE 07203]MBE9097155.1 hypothetical protein [Tychonema sp. LEGE 07203]